MKADRSLQLKSE